MYLALGAASYTAACAVGLWAHLGAHLAPRFRPRWLHHAAYAAALLGTAAATFTRFHPGLLLPGAVLAILPRFRAGGAVHRRLAITGLVGYAAAYALPWS